ncbi:MAG: hypothetical protein QMC89_01675 [Candidatus Hodarchaeaceae archaeon]|nr:hypothetical protein [Candidatus Hodarchaeaceae archaeon]
MFSYVFLLGRPGSGKSAVYKMFVERMLREGLASEVMRIDDFPILKQILDEDVEFKRHVRKEGGFEVTDFSILDDVLKRINGQLKELQKPGRVIFVEFSRDSYANALGNFDDGVLSRSLLVYIYCPFEVCLERNARRFKEGLKDVDDHIVPRDLMEKYYRYDDYEELFLKSENELKARAPAPIVVVKNNVEGLDHLKLEIEKVVTALKI